MMPLETERLILRNWRESDRELFHLINSDAQVMEFFVMRRNRTQSDAMMDRLAQGIEQNGFGLAAVEIAETGQVAGFTGLNIRPSCRRRWGH
jgi:RimJ/RimL family protein N-acetyltransferase